ncbi:MAG: glycerol-3-phosphate 1-O-acyltransferase PlsY [Kiritimatiellae bacterium]|nr:glycerol-3-phosphate 1-O-acyltransferase PlsY [Kiritimatiellia bacterium]
MQLGLISILFCAVSYLSGAIPFGFLFGLARGIDVREEGSGNIGATNVFRTVGKGWGVLTFILDVVKGFIPAFLLPLAVGRMTDAYGELPGLGVLFGIWAVAGHNWPVFLGFKGGKGVATTAGVLLGVAWESALIGLVAWLVIFLSVRYVSLASMSAALIIPAAGWWLYVGDDYFLRPVVLSLLGAVVIMRHHANIERLRKGTENRFRFGKKG